VAQISKVGWRRPFLSGLRLSASTNLTATDATKSSLDHFPEQGDATVGGLAQTFLFRSAPVCVDESLPQPICHQIFARPLPGTRLHSLMAVSRRYFAPGHLQFITTSTYRRVPVFLNPAYCQLFVDALRAVRSKIDFLLIGWVLMPDHFHVLVQPGLNQSTSNIVKEVKQRSAFAILEALRDQSNAVSSRLLLRSLRLPATVHSRAHYRL
jgi:REP element-mobilizing transposase RayT